MKRTKAARVSTMRRLLAGITATALLSAQTERAFACQTQAFNVAGQTIRLTVTFFTNDPNEDGEGEPVLISSSGGFFVQQDSHVQMTYDVVSTVDNEVFTGTFGGEAPDGDESCSLSTDTQKRNMLTPDQKRVLNDVINDLVLSGASTTAICAVTCPLVPPFTPVCVGMCVITVFGDALLAWRLRRMVNDPADPNFMVFAMPSFTMLTCGATGVPQNVSDSCDALYLGDQRAIGLAVAILATFNKAQGAAQANDTFWEGQQMAHAADLESQLGDELVINATLRGNFQSALQAWGSFPQQPALTPNDVYQGQSDLFDAEQGATGAFPLDPHTILSALGADADDEQNTIQSVITQNNETVAMIPNMPATLTWQPLVDALNTAGGVFSGHIGVDECWKLSAHNIPFAPLFHPLDVPMVDRFGSTMSDVKKANEACFPAISGPDDKVLPTKGETEAYRLKANASFLPRTVTVMNDLDLVGSQVTIFGEDSLRVPATIPEWPNQAQPITGYLKCYKAHGPSLDITLPQVSDGFMLVFQPVQIRTPSKVCVPVNVHGLDPTAPSSPEAVVCYRARTPLRSLGLLVSQDVIVDDGTVHALPNSATLKSYKEYCLPSNVQ